MNERLLLNYQNALNDCIWSAILASSALPQIVPPVELYAKDPTRKIVQFYGFGKCWADGYIMNDRPTKIQTFNVSYTIVSQANQHVVPFAFSSEGYSGEPPRHNHGVGFRRGFLPAGVEKLLKLEMLKWMQRLTELDLMSRLYGHDWSNLTLQEFKGDVTIYAQPSISDYIWLMSDPTHSEMERFFGRGQLACWHKLCMISHRLHLDQLL
eukprot:624044_1